MKKRTLLFLPLLFAVILGHAQVNESFTDGNFTTAPAWIGNTDSFIVNGSSQLQSNAAGVTGIKYYLSTANTLATSAQWEFYVNLKFSVSGANYVDVYLTASSADLTAPANSGYFVRIGNTQKEINLYKKGAGGANDTTKIIHGSAGIVASTSNNSIRIKVTRDAANLWTLYRDMTGGVTYTSEGSATDNTYLSSSFFGFLITESSAVTPRKNHYFDDIVIQPYVQDVTAPTVQSVTVNNANTLDVLFNEPVDAASSQLVNNYSVNNAVGTPVSAVRDVSNTSLVHLTFTNSFPNTVTSTITINGVKDLTGNAIVNGTAGFTYFAAYVAKQYDVVIDEIMADPDPAIALPAGREWVELKNTNNNAINLKDWRIKDATGQSGAFPAYVLKPGSYVILCGTSSASKLSVYGDTLSVTSFPSLNNTGESLTLVNDAGIVMHSVSYSLAWYHDVVKAAGGWTLEMINTASPCSGISNWAASTNANGGTPGIINSVNGGTTDVTGPVLSNIIVTGNQDIQLVFNERLDSLKGATASNYSISNALAVQKAVTVSPGFDTVNIHLASASISGQQYTVTATGIADCLGNITNNNSATFTYYTPYTAQQYDVVIDEIMADESPVVGLPQKEWIELKNTTASAINLTGWRISDASGQSGPMPTFTLLPDSFVVICTSAAVPLLSVFGTTISVTSFPSLNNDGEQLTLTDANGKIIYAVKYSSDWYKDDKKKDGGWTLEMINTKSPCSGATNWIASTDPAGGTPGKKNSVDSGIADITGPALLGAVAIDATHVMLNFDETIDSIKGATISNYSITNNITVLSGSTQAPLFNQVMLELGTALIAGNEYTITANGLTDCIGNTTASSTAKVILSAPPAKYDLVVNEILFNPKPSINGQPAGVDYVEIYNRSNKAVDLSKVYLTNRSSTTGTIGSLDPLSINSRLLLPHEFAVATLDPAIVMRDFIAQNPAAFLSMTSMPSYPDDKGYVIICDIDTNIIDEIPYSDKWQFPLIDNTEGVALERINYDDTTIDNPLTPNMNEQAQNWHSAATSAGYGTPTYKNSQYRLDQQVEGTITIEPEIFSPDNDGTDDFTTVNYNFPEPGYVANITIFDASGRPVKYLQKNALCGIKGSFRWDGLSEKNQKLAIGIYIVYTEIFNLKGKKKTFKNQVVLARRY